MVVNLPPINEEWCDEPRRDKVVCGMRFLFFWWRLAKRVGYSYIY